MLFLSGPPMFLHAISEFERNFNYRLTVLFKIIGTVRGIEYRKVILDTMRSMY